MPKTNTGILLINIGSPAAPTPSAVRHYLKKFLSDPRVVEINPLLWQPILRGFILPFRSKKSAKLYQQIWTSDGAPLMVFSQKIADKLQQQLQVPVVLGTHYGLPDIASALDQLQQAGVKKIICLPLYPQYSATTTASAFDQIAASLKKCRQLPEISTIHSYAENEHYINALTESIQHHFNLHGQAQHLLFSFHGIPQRYADSGDPYPTECHTSVRLVAEKLNLKKESWSVAFQSRIGRTPWLKPYTDQVLYSLPQRGIEHLQVVCPGFAVDCLETLEEIALRGKLQFLQAGGKCFEYIPALNDDCVYLARILQGFLPYSPRY